MRYFSRLPLTSSCQ